MNNFTNRMQDVLRLSKEEAMRTNKNYIGTEHLLLGIIREGEGIAIKILRNLGVHLYKIKKTVEDTIQLPQDCSLTPDEIVNLIYTKQAEKILKITHLEAKLYKSDVIGTEHLLLSLLRDEYNIAAQILYQFNINYESVRNELDKIIRGDDNSETIYSNFSQEYKELLKKYDIQSSCFIYQLKDKKIGMLENGEENSVYSLWSIGYKKSCSDMDNFILQLKINATQD